MQQSQKRCGDIIGDGQMRIPIRYKIILPFAVLLVFVGVVGTGVATARLTNAAAAEFDASLLHSSLTANQALSQLEADRVAQLRAAANTVGVGDAVAAGDHATLAKLLAPIAANAEPANLEIRVLDASASQLVSVIGAPTGPAIAPVQDDGAQFASEPAVANVLAGKSDAFGERYLFMQTGPAGTSLYWVGPVRDNLGQIRGAVLIGQSLAEIAQNLPGSAFYDLSGHELAASVVAAAPLDRTVLSRITALNTVVLNPEAGHTYGSLFSRWTMRGTALGYLAVQANADQLEGSIVQVRLILTLVFTAAALLTLLVGGVTASLLTRPIEALVRSMRQISGGDLHHRAPVTSKDEIGFLAQTFNEMAASLESTTAELESTYFASMEALARAIDARDPSTFGHSERVAAISVQIADEMGITLAEREALRRAALLHDIGKIGIEDRVLRKPGPLNDQEAGDMQEHPRIGYEMLKGLRFLQPSLPGVLHHHERWDGGGYPHGLSGIQIPLAVRILTVADVFDAMTSDRPYRQDLGVEVASESIRQDAGIRFDPDVVAAFLSRRDAIVSMLKKMRASTPHSVRPSEAA